ncbi:hypothetical protein Tco_0903454 [Tanacetum coccineum]
MVSINRFSKHDVYSPLKILSVVIMKVDKLHSYGYLEEIMVKKADRQLYKLKEGDFINRHLNDIEDMLLLLVQHKLFHLDDSEIVDLAMALHMFTRSLIIKRRVKDFQLELYTPSFDPPGVVFEDLSHQKRLMRANELYKFSDGTLKKVHGTLHRMLLNFRFGYNKDMPRKKWLDSDKRRLGNMVDLIDKQMLSGKIGRYGVSMPTLTKDHKENKSNMPYPGKAIRRIQAIREYNILEDIKRGPYSKKLQYVVSNTLDTPMDDSNITMEEYIRLEEEKAQKHGKVFNWETAKYGKISVETEFSAIAFNDKISPEKTLSCEPTVSSLNDKIHFRISFDDSDDEDYTDLAEKKAIILVENLQIWRS